MDASSPTESSCPWTQCPGQLSFCDINDPAWMAALIGALAHDGWAMVERINGVVLVSCGHGDLTRSLG